MGRPRTGTVMYRHGRWYARITLHRRPPQGGRPPRVEVVAEDDAGQPVTRKNATGRALAKALAVQLQQLYDAGKWEPASTSAPPPEAPAPAILTVAAWCDEWLAGQTYSEAKRDRRRTAAALAYADRDGWTLGAVELAVVTPQDLARWLAVVRAQVSAKGTPRAPRTVRNTLDPVARALRGAVFAGRLVHDPAASLPTDVRPQAEDADPTAHATRRLSLAETETLLGEPSVVARWSIVWHLLLLTGAREAEVIALRWSDILLDAPLARVRLATQIHHRTRERSPTKTRAVKDVPLHPVLAAALESWRTDGWREEYGRAPTSTDLVVPARGRAGRHAGVAAGVGGPLWQQDIHRALQRDLLACGIRPHRVHDLRHTFVSLCADFGVSPEIAARWTHAPLATAGSRHLYLVPSWTRQCEECLRLRVVPRRVWATGNGRHEKQEPETG